MAEKISLNPLFKWCGPPLLRIFLGRLCFPVGPTRLSRSPFISLSLPFMTFPAPPPSRSSGQASPPPVLAYPPFFFFVGMAFPLRVNQTNHNGLFWAPSSSSRPCSSPHGFSPSQNQPTYMPSLFSVFPSGRPLPTTTPLQFFGTPTIFFFDFCRRFPPLSICWSHKSLSHFISLSHSVYIPEPRPPSQQGFLHFSSPFRFGPSWCNLARISFFPPPLSFPSFPLFFLFLESTMSSRISFSLSFSAGFPSVSRMKICVVSWFAFTFVVSLSAPEDLGFPPFTFPLVLYCFARQVLLNDLEIVVWSPLLLDPGRFFENWSNCFREAPFPPASIFHHLFFLLLSSCWAICWNEGRCPAITNFLWLFFFLSRGWMTPLTPGSLPFLISSLFLSSIVFLFPGPYPAFTIPITPLLLCFFPSDESQYCATSLWIAWVAVFTSPGRTVSVDFLSFPSYSSRFLAWNENKFFSCKDSPSGFSCLILLSGVELFLCHDKEYVTRLLEFFRPFSP